MKAKSTYVNLVPAAEQTLKILLFLSQCETLSPRRHFLRDTFFIRR